MITGASQAGSAVLIIDVNEGIKEQTKRHAYILSLLGLTQVIVVLNKMDMVDFSQDRYRQLQQESAGFLKTINIVPLFYIPISAMKGENITARSEKMPWYKGPIFLESLDSLKLKQLPQNKHLIFPVQDVYKIEDKRIVVGRVESGIIRAGDQVKILPSNQATKIQSIEKFLQNPQKAVAGESIGIITRDEVFLNRGDILCEEEKEPVLTDTFYANIFWMGKMDFDKQQRLVIRCATQETSCKIETIKKRINSSTLELIEEDAAVLKNLEVAQVLIKTKKPIAIKAFNDVQELGRFVFVQDENIHYKIY